MTSGETEVASTHLKANVLIEFKSGKEDDPKKSKK